MSGIADLIERLEKLEGPSREVDARICESAGYEVRGHDGRDYYEPIPEYSWQEVPKYTTYLDTATALVERVLPGWDWTAARSGQAYGGYVYPLDFSPSDNPNEVSAA